MPDRLLRIISTVLLAFIAVTAFAQGIPTRHYTVEDGLPSNTVYEVHRDHNGFLWFATDKGIARYNGIRFERVTTENGLPDNDVFYFMEDMEARLWMGCFNGELAYYQSGVFHSGDNTPALRLSFAESFTTYIKPEADSSITFGYNQHIVNVRGNIYTTYSKQRLLGSTGIKLGSFFYSRKAGPATYTFYSPKRVVTVDTNGRILKDIVPADSLKAPVLSQGYYAVLTPYGIVDDELRYIKRFPKGFHRPSLYQFGIFGHDTIYTTNNGLYINDSLCLLHGLAISNITCDQQGNYWVSTLGSGVYFFLANFRNTRLYQFHSHNVVKYATAKRGHILFSDDNHIYDLHKGQVSSLLQLNKISVFASGEKHFAYQVDSNFNTYIFGTRGAAHVDNLLSPTTRITAKKYDTVKFEPKDVASSQGNFFLRCYLHVFVITDSAFSAHAGSLPVTDAISNERITHAETAKDGSAWLAGTASMHKFWGNREQRPEGYDKLQLKYFHFLGNGIIGYTWKNRLLWCHMNKGKIITDTIRHQNCLWDKFYKLNDSAILASTNNQYRVISLHTTAADTSVYVSVVENETVPVRAEEIAMDSATCYFFKNGTITSIEKNSILAQTMPPKLFYTFLRTGVRIAPIKPEMKLHFYEARNITIGFSTLSMGSKEVRYLYSFSKNSTDNWRVTQGEQLNIVISGYGKFIIKVRARTQGSTYSAPITLVLFVDRPFWASWWFIAMAAFALLLGIAIALRFRIRYLLTRKEKEYNSQIRFLRSEYKAMNALMNPHFIFNTLNNVQSLVNANDKLAANEYLRIFADLVRQNMHNVSQETIPLRKELDLVSNYLMLEKLRFEDKLNYDISMEIDLHLSEIQIPPLILQPLVENAVKHGVLKMRSGQGYIKVKVYEENDNLYMEVRDNGAGLANQATNASGHVSFGTGNIRKRVEQLSMIQGKKIHFILRSERDQYGTIWTVATLCMPM